MRKIVRGCRCMSYRIRKYSRTKVEFETSSSAWQQPDFVFINLLKKRTSPSNMTRTTRSKPARKMKYSPPPSPASSGRSGTSSPGQGRGKVGPASPPRRPIRPVDRQKMLDWLRDKLDNNEMSNKLSWEVKDKVFIVRWPHAARHGFSKDDDAELYRAYAEHTGLYRAGEQGDHKRWKANFRCALRSVPNVKEIPCKDGRKGPNAARRYQILDTPEVRNRKTLKKLSRPERSPEHNGENLDSCLSVEAQDNLPLPVSTMLEVPAVTSVVEARQNIPNFKHLGLTMCIQPNLLSGGSFKELSPDAASSPPSSLITPLPTQSFTTTTTSFPITSSIPTPSLTLTPSPGLATPFPTCSSSLFQSFPVLATTTTPITSSIPTPTPSPSFPNPTTITIPTPTPSFPIPTPFSNWELPEDLAQDMVPVAIMIRDRTPSGDSGLPGSPTVGREEVVVGTEFLVDMEELSVDEGIEILGEVGANECIGISENGCMERAQDILLDISSNKPGMTDAAVAVKTGIHNDFTYACLQLPTTTMGAE